MKIEINLNLYTELGFLKKKKVISMNLGSKVFLLDLTLTLFRMGFFGGLLKYGWGFRALCKLSAVVPKTSCMCL